MSNKTAYKFLMGTIKNPTSQHDGSGWTIGAWRDEPKPTEACKGLNASRLIPDALCYVNGTVLAKVEYRGVVIDSGDKMTCESMRIVESWDWTPEMSVRLTIYAAKKALKIYTKYNPDDQRPAQAIQAAQDYLDGKRSAAAARAAANAAAAAVAAARAAGYAAANAAADAARAAAYAAADAAADAVADAAANAAAAAVAAARAAGYAAAYAAADAVADAALKRQIHLYALRLCRQMEDADD